MRAARAARQEVDCAPFEGRRGRSKSRGSRLSPPNSRPPSPTRPSSRLMSPHYRSSRSRAPVAKIKRVPKSSAIKRPRPGDKSALRCEGRRRLVHDATSRFPMPYPGIQQGRPTRVSSPTSNTRRHGHEKKRPTRDQLTQSGSRKVLFESRPTDRNRHTRPRSANVRQSRAISGRVMIPALSSRAKWQSQPRSSIIQGHPTRSRVYGKEDGDQNIAHKKLKPRPSSAPSRRQSKESGRGDSIMLELSDMAGGSRKTHDELRIMKWVVLRETYLAKLHGVVSAARKRAKSASSNRGSSGLQNTAKGRPKLFSLLIELLTVLRRITVEIVEAIESWRGADSKKPFVWGSSNYLIKVAGDVAFLASLPDLEQHLGVRISNNPFLCHVGLDGAPAFLSSNCRRDRGRAQAIDPKSGNFPIGAFGSLGVSAERIEAAVAVLHREVRLVAVKRSNSSSEVKQITNQKDGRWPTRLWSTVAVDREGQSEHRQDFRPSFAFNHVGNSGAPPPDNGSLDYQNGAAPSKNQNMGRNKCANLNDKRKPSRSWPTVAVDAGGESKYDQSFGRSVPRDETDNSGALLLEREKSRAQDTGTYRQVQLPIREGERPSRADGPYRVSQDYGRKPSGPGQTVTLGLGSETKFRKNSQRPSLSYEQGGDFGLPEPNHENSDFLDGPEYGEGRLTVERQRQSHSRGHSQVSQEGRWGENEYTEPDYSNNQMPRPSLSNYDFDDSGATPRDSKNIEPQDNARYHENWSGGVAQRVNCPDESINRRTSQDGWQSVCGSNAIEPLDAEGCLEYSRGPWPAEHFDEAEGTPSHPQSHLVELSEPARDKNWQEVAAQSAVPMDTEDVNFQDEMFYSSRMRRRGSPFIEVIDMCDGMITDLQGIGLASHNVKGTREYLLLDADGNHGNSHSGVTDRERDEGRDTLTENPPLPNVHIDARDEEPSLRGSMYGSFTRDLQAKCGPLSDKRQQGQISNRYNEERGPDRDRANQLTQEMAEEISVKYLSLWIEWIKAQLRNRNAKAAKHHRRGQLGRALSKFKAHRAIAFQGRMAEAFAGEFGISRYFVRLAFNALQAHARGARIAARNQNVLELLGAHLKRVGRAKLRQAWWRWLQAIRHRGAEYGETLTRLSELWTKGQLRGAFDSWQRLALLHQVSRVKGKVKHAKSSATVVSSPDPQRTPESTAREGQQKSQSVPLQQQENSLAQWLGEESSQHDTSSTEEVGGGKVPRIVTVDIVEEDKTAGGSQASPKFLRGLGARIKSMKSFRGIKDTAQEQRQETQSGTSPGAVPGKSTTPNVDPQISKVAISVIDALQAHRGTTSGNPFKLVNPQCLDEAAIRIQHAWKMSLERQVVLRAIHSTMLIQRLWRLRFRRHRAGFQAVRAWRQRTRVLTHTLNQALVEAAGEGDLRAVAFLLRPGLCRSVGGDPNATGTDGTNALHAACQGGYPGSKNKPKHTVPDSNGFGSKANNGGKGKSFGQSGNKKAQDRPDWAGVIKALVEAGAMVEAKNVGGFTPMMTAAGQGGAETISALAAVGAEVDAVEAGGGKRTPLVIAAQKANVPATAALLECGARVNFPAGDGLTPLHEAVGAGSIAVAETLVRAGAKVNAISESEEMTPLHLAVANDQHAAARLLVHSGADVCIPDARGLTPLRLTVEMADVPTVALMLTAEPPPDLGDEDENGKTVLHAACRLGLTDIVQLLLGAGADPHARDVHEITPELVALSLGHADCARLCKNVEIFSPVRQKNSQPVPISDEEDSSEDWGRKQFDVETDIDFSSPGEGLDTENGGEDVEDWRREGDAARPEGTSMEEEHESFDGTWEGREQEHEEEGWAWTEEGGWQNVQEDASEEQRISLSSSERGAETAWNVARKRSEISSGGDGNQAKVAEAGFAHEDTDLARSGYTEQAEDTKRGGGSEGGGGENNDDWGRLATEGWQGRLPDGPSEVPMLTEQAEEPYSPEILTLKGYGLADHEPRGSESYPDIKVQKNEIGGGGDGGDGGERGSDVEGEQCVQTPNKPEGTEARAEGSADQAEEANQGSDENAEEDGWVWSETEGWQKTFPSVPTQALAFVDVDKDPHSFETFTVTEPEGLDCNQSWNKSHTNMPLFDNQVGDRGRGGGGNGIEREQWVETSDGSWVGVGRTEEQKGHVDGEHHQQYNDLRQKSTSYTHGHYPRNERVEPDYVVKGPLAQTWEGYDEQDMGRGAWPTVKTEGGTGGDNRGSIINITDNEGCANTWKTPPEDEAAWSTNPDNLTLDNSAGIFQGGGRDDGNIEASLNTYLTPSDEQIDVAQQQEHVLASEDGQVDGDGRDCESYTQSPQDGVGDNHSNNDSGEAQRSLEVTEKLNSTVSEVDARRPIAWGGIGRVLQDKNRWLSVVDEKSGSVYYRNQQSGVTQWETPESGAVIEREDMHGADPSVA